MLSADMKTTKALLISLPVELVELVDGIRGDVPRTVWIKRAVEAAVMPAVGESVRAILAALPPVTPDPEYDKAMGLLVKRERERERLEKRERTREQDALPIGSIRKRMVRDEPV